MVAFSFSFSNILSELNREETELQKFNFEEAHVS